MTLEQNGLFSKKSCPWLLLFVFYLQFITGEVLNMLWQKYFGTDVPRLVALAGIQIFAVALPCLVFIFLKNVKFGDVIKHRKLDVVTVFMCILTGAAAQPIAALLNSPVTLHMNQQASAVVGTPSGALSVILTLLVVAVMPAIFEEVLMRGIILCGTERYGYRASLLISGLWFAILHNNPSNFFGMLFLGAVTCYAVWMTQSVYCGMIIHFSFNACGMIMQMTQFPKGTLSSVLLLVVAAVIFFPSVSALNRKLVRRYKTRGLVKQLLSAIFNFPMIVILLGYAMFYFTK